MATALTAFRSRVLPNVPQCPDLICDLAVLDACIEFSEKTNIVRETSDPVEIIAGQPTMDIDVSPGKKIVQVQHVWVGQSELIPASEDNIGVFNYVDTITGETPSPSKPRNFSEPSPGVIAFYPRPDMSYYVTVRLSTKPSRAATSVDDVLFEDWANVIADGALAKLYLMKADWQDPARAAIHSKAFDSGIGDAILESRRGRNRSEDVVKPVFI